MSPSGSSCAFDRETGNARRSALPPAPGIAMFDQTTTTRTPVGTRIGPTAEDGFQLGSAIVRCVALFPVGWCGTRGSLA